MKLEFALEAPNFSSTADVEPWWHMRPATGIWWADTLWLFVIAALDHHILPSIFGSWLAIDILTPWLVVFFVVSPTPWAIAICILGSLLLETATDAPRGMYVCAYWMILCVLLLTRRTLSWKHTVPWFVTFFVASFWVHNFETIVISLREDSKQLDFTYFFRQLIQMTTGCMIGMTIAQRWMIRFKGDRVKGDVMTQAERRAFP